MIFFISLVVIMMLEIVSIELDFASGFRKYMIHGVIGAKVFIKNLLYLEDFLDLLDLPEVDHDGLGHLH